MSQTTRTYQPPLQGWGTPLRIAMVAACPFPTAQGTQVFIRHLAQALAGAGHEVHLFTYGEGEQGVELGHADNLYLHRARALGVGTRSGPQLRKPFADASLLPRCHRALSARPHDILHVHNVEGLAVGAALRHLDGLPLVYHVHNAMGAELPTYFKRNRVRRTAAWLGELADRSLPKLADAVITFDDDHKALHEMYGISESRLHVIPPGLDPNEIRGAHASTIASLKQFIGPGPWILYAGNPDGYQNLPLLWKAYAKVRRKMPSAGLLIASHHPPAAFEDVLPPPSARQGIRLFQHRDLEELRAAFAIASVGVCPRVLWTGAPIKVLNYLAAGLPVVACRDAVRHILTPGSGEAVSADPANFASSILKILHRNERHQHHASHAFDRFRIDTQVALYEQVYRNVLHAE